MDYLVKISGGANLDYYLSDDQALVIGVGGVTHKFPILNKLTAQMSLQLTGAKGEEYSTTIDVLPMVDLPAGYKFVTFSGSYVMVDGAFAVALIA